MTTLLPLSTGGALLAQEAPEAEVQRGLVLYRELYCGICHASSKAGTKGVFGPGHDAVAIIAGARIHDPTYAGDARDAVGYLEESILQPERFIVPGYVGAIHRMPAYTHLSEADLDALLAFLLSLDGTTTTR